jgi:spermidine/putrescine transport system substrate-binding protein
LADKPFLKKVAEEYINELLSTDYQIGHILRVVGTLPVISDIDSLLTPEEKQRIKLGTLNSLSTNRILLPTCSRRDRNGLRILWQEAMEGIAINKGME